MGNPRSQESVATVVLTIAGMTCGRALVVTDGARKEQG